MRRRTIGHSVHPIPIALRDSYGDRSGYLEALKLFNEAVDKWYSPKKVKKNIIGIQISSKTDYFIAIEEMTPNIKKRTLTLKGGVLKLRLELYLDRDLMRTREVFIKYGDIAAPTPIVEGKVFSLGTHKNTVKTYIRDVLADIQKKQPRI